MKNAKGISQNDLIRYSNEYKESDFKKIMSVALSKNELSEIAFDEIYAGKLIHKFSVEVETMTATDQMQSGRCWLFAALNLLRETVGKKINCEFFEFSENYIAFFDKFEKINYFLESVIDTAHLPLDDRTVFHILGGINDGGQWDMVVSLIEKYGLVPKTAMPETHASSHTNTAMKLINMQLREYAAELRGLISEGKDPQEAKDRMLSEMYGLLCMCFGAPPSEFDFEYVDKDKKYNVERNLTPKSFYDKYCGTVLSNYISVINAPTSDKPYNRTYTVSYLGNVVGGRDILYLNTEMDTLKELIITTLRDGQAVWFGSDVSKFGDREKGIWDTNSFKFAEILGIPLSLSKSDGLLYRDSAMNHAMLITGVNFGADGTPDRWKIENSWGAERAEKGYYIMGDDWFTKYVYQAVIDKKYLSDKLKKALEEDPIVLPPWDPMGSLA